MAATRVMSHYFRRPIIVEALLLVSIAIVLISKVVRGVLIFYIHPRYVPLIVICAILLLVIAVARLRTSHQETVESGQNIRISYLLLLIPALLGIAVPARPLGVNALSGSDVGSLPLTSAADTPSLDEDSTSWDLLAWVMALSVNAPEMLSGKPADVIGFVFKNPDSSFDGFYVMRYVITCCTADSEGTGLPVVWQGAAPPPDSWVRVRATLGTVPIDGLDEPALIASAVEIVPMPTPPYLYP